jgi:hypothetical protein
MTTDYIQALGNLLATYQSDLTYIRDFHRYKSGQLISTDYIKKSPGSFKSFIDEFGVARNVDKTQIHILLSLTTEWLNQNQADNVDNFANLLKEKGITHGKVMTSLASKILFLNNPWVILPLDTLAKRSVGLRTNKYSQYLPLTESFVSENKIAIDNSLNSVDKHLKIIEGQFNNELHDIKLIRQNRFVDKLLWTKGRI